MLDESRLIIMRFIKTTVCQALFVSMAISNTLVYSHVGSHSHSSERSHDEIPTVVIDASDAKNPWSSLDLNNDPRNFQFAIVSDNTGGRRDGVLEDAFKKLNWLQPEFVMSVGDLIQGYTENREQVNAEWDEFEGFVDKLEMPFFYVAGNHDYTNPSMGKIWKERFGESYYHFTYQDVLFVMLNSNDAGRPHSMTTDQVDWLEGVLEENPDPRWTLVFVHSPLWDRNDHNLWPDVENLLKDRKHTVFAGHSHRYIKHVRDDMNYYTLATTGGGSGLRGPRFGEFDHVMWATMTDDGPVLANLLLEGIWSDDVRTEETRAVQAKLIDDRSLAVRPILFRDAEFKRGTTELRFTNDSDFPVNLEIELTQKIDMRFDGERIRTMSVDPNEVVVMDFSFQNNDKSFDGGVIASVAWKLNFERDGETIAFEGEEQIVAVRELLIEKAEEIEVDGNTEDWGTLPFSVTEIEDDLNKDGSWKGKEDSSFRFGISADEEYLYVGVDVLDDANQANPKERSWMQDNVSIGIDVRPVGIRSISSGRGRDVFTLIPGRTADDLRVEREDRLPEGSLYVAKLTKSGFQAEIAIPVEYINQQAGKAWDGVRVNVSVNDRDPKEPRGSRLNWQTPWGDRDSLSGSGSFYNEYSRKELKDDSVIETIAFGSCVHQDREQAIWGEIVNSNPDLFIFAGDNIYADTMDPNVMEQKYMQLRHNRGFQDLKAVSPIMATWDDHDYGINDGGIEFPMKEESQRQFLEFFEEPKDSKRWDQKGIYDARIVGPEGKRVQIILLDTRYHRGPLARVDRIKGKGPYGPSSDTSVSLLGEEQWTWLEKQLRKPADLRIVVSSIQVVAYEHGWEGWGTLPHERDRLYELIEETEANGVVFLSGDRHLIEISKDTEETPYPMWDFTSSGFNWGNQAVVEPNRFREGPVFREPNFGLIHIDWSDRKTTVALEGISENGDVLTSAKFQLSELRN